MESHIPEDGKGDKNLSKSEIALNTHYSALAQSLNDYIARGKELSEQGEDWVPAFTSVKFNCRNGYTNRPYNGSNQIMLSAAVNSHPGWLGDMRWYTMHQATDKGYKIKPEYAGFEGYPITSGSGNYVKGKKGPLFEGDPEADPDYGYEDNKSGKDKETDRGRGGFSGVRIFRVFNASWFDGVEPDKELERRFKKTTSLLQQEDDKEEIARLRFLTAALAVSSPIHPYFRVSVQTPCFVPTMYRIVLPTEDRLSDDNGKRTAVEAHRDMVANLLHEMAHSTAIPLQREIRGTYGSQRYAEEELIAELTAATVGRQLMGDGKMGMGTKLGDNQAKYLNSWFSRVGDVGYFEKIAREAKKAGDLILTSFKKDMKELDPDFHMSFDNKDPIEQRIQRLADKFDAHDLSCDLQHLVFAIDDGISRAKATKRLDRIERRLAAKESQKEEGPDL